MLSSNKICSKISKILLKIDNYDDNNNNNNAIKR